MTAKLALEMPATKRDGRSTFTRTEYEKEVTRLEDSNLNLQFRVAQLEEALAGAGMQIESEQDISTSELAPPSQRGGVKTAAELSEHEVLAAQDVMDVTRRALEEEWRTVQKVHDEVETLKSDIQMGKIPAEPEERRRSYMRQMQSLQEKLGLMEAEALALRQNSKESRRMHDNAVAERDRMERSLLEEQEKRKTVERQNELLKNKVWELERRADVPSGATAEMIVKVQALEGRLTEQAVLLEGQERAYQIQRGRALRLEAELEKVKRGEAELEKSRRAKGRVKGRRAEENEGGGSGGEEGEEGERAGGESGVGHGPRRWEGERAALLAKADKSRQKLLKARRAKEEVELQREALEAEAVEARTALLQEQLQRQELSGALEAERRQHAFAAKRVVRLEAEASTSREVLDQRSRQIVFLKKALDQIKIQQPDPPANHALLRIGQGGVRDCSAQTSPLRAEEEGGEGSSRRQHVSLEGLATRVSAALGEQREEELEEEVAELRVEVERLRAEGERGQAQLRKARQQGEETGNKRGRRTSGVAANRASLQMWEEMAAQRPAGAPMEGGSGEGGGRRAPAQEGLGGRHGGGGAVVQQGGVASRGEVVALRRRVGELEVECAGLQEEVERMQGEREQAVSREGQQGGDAGDAGGAGGEVERLLLESQLYRRDHALQAAAREVAALLAEMNPQAAQDVAGSESQQGLVAEEAAGGGASGREGWFAGVERQLQGGVAALRGEFSGGLRKMAMTAGRLEGSMGRLEGEAMGRLAVMGRRLQVAEQSVGSIRAGHRGGAAADAGPGDDGRGSGEGRSRLAPERYARAAEMPEAEERERGARRGGEGRGDGRGVAMRVSGVEAEAGRDGGRPGQGGEAGRPPGTPSQGPGRAGRQKPMRERFSELMKARKSGQEVGRGDGGEGFPLEEESARGQGEEQRSRGGGGAFPETEGGASGRSGMVGEEEEERAEDARRGGGAGVHTSVRGEEEMVAEAQLGRGHGAPPREEEARRGSGLESYEKRARELQEQLLVGAVGEVAGQAESEGVSRQRGVDGAASLGGADDSGEDVSEEEGLYAEESFEEEEDQEGADGGEAPQEQAAGEMGDAEEGELGGAEEGREVEATPPRAVRVTVGGLLDGGWVGVGDGEDEREEWSSKGSTPVYSPRENHGQGAGAGDVADDDDDAISESDDSPPLKGLPGRGGMLSKHPSLAALKREMAARRFP